MPDAKQLPHLIRLLDDETPAVRQSVMEELVQFGPALDEELSRLKIVLSSSQHALIQDLFQEHARTRLRQHWAPLLDVHDPTSKLEFALSLLSEFNDARHTSLRLSGALDYLSEEFRSIHSSPDARLLAEFLFQTKGFKGVDHEDYYHACNSDLLYVIEHKVGIPISLACLYILIGKRLGLIIKGCNLPGHFLASATMKGKNIIVDCFHGGHIIDENDLATMKISVRITMVDLLRLECEGETIIARVLRNLYNAYERGNKSENMSLMHELMQSLPIDEDESPSSQ